MTARLVSHALTALLGVSVAAAGADNMASIGFGTYYTKPKSGMLSGAAVPPAAEYRVGEAAARAAPTNQWYSSLMFERSSEPLHAHPMTYRAVAEGFELGLPERRMNSNDAGQREVRYPHVAAVLISPVAFKPQGARLSDFSDWLAQIRMAAASGEALTATILHGSPFSYFECSAGDVRFRLAGAPNVLADPRASGHDPRVASFTIGGHAYAVFAPTGASWDWAQPNDLVLHLPGGRRYFSVAGLPDDHEATLRDFLAVAYAFPTSTRANWDYDAAKSLMRTTYRVDTEAKEGDQRTTFMGLYPHQWTALASPPASQYRYDSVRGTIRLIAGNSFTVERVYHGILPEWAGLEDAAHRSAVDGLMAGDLAKSEGLYSRNSGTYGVGRGLGAAGQLMSICEAEGLTAGRDKLLRESKSRLESWFDGRHATYFMQDSRIGTLVGYPEENASVSHVNDHHAQYGYWVTGAAQVALRDPDWASEAKWGGMVGKIIDDIATSERGRADFPFIRNFDTFEGHSWASGDAASSDDGNNQESSSEAINAWAGLILWGEATGNARIRDLGIYLYTTEVASAQTYWFDLRHEVLAPEYGKPFASQVFGAKYVYNPRWTLEPQKIFGINWLPYTPASTYLGASPEYMRTVMADLSAEETRYAAHEGNPKGVWQDFIAEYLALADPDAALARWNKQGSVEYGETRTHALYWTLSLKEMGSPDMSVTADTALYSVFTAPNGAHTYLAYNARNEPIHVTFSDGKTLDVPARSLARAH